jgi:hypothetical protein
MQSEYATPGNEAPAAVLLLGRGDDPQAVINTTEVTAASATDMRRRVLAGTKPF